MTQEHLIFTQQDHLILRSYFSVADGVAEFCGDSCEVVIHNLEHLDHSVVKIVNGHLSGRQAGAPISDVTLTFLNQMIENPEQRSLCYFAKNKRGEDFKSTLNAIVNENNNIIGLFCINFYLNMPLLSVIQSLLPSEKAKNDNISETFVENTEELMLLALNDAKKNVYADTSISSSNKNKEIIALLYKKGIFNLKDAVVIIAGHLGISKNTVYMHLRNIK